MARTVLVIEDEQSASRLICGIAQEAGLSARSTRSGTEALQLCATAAQSGAPFAAIVLDLVLGELDGFQFAAAARGAEWGQKLPIVVVSGIYKKLPDDFAARARPDAFFAKPFEPAALRDALARLTGAEQAAPSAEVRLADKPAAALLVDLLRAKATGVLTLSHDETRRAITFQQGMVRFAQSNVRQEAIGAAQVASGQIKQASFDRGVALAKQQGVPLYEALASARVMSPDQLKSALKQQLVDVCVGAVAMAQGTSKFYPKPAEQVQGVPDLRTSPVVLVFEAARKLGNPTAAQAWLEQRRAERMRRSPELERELFSLKASWPGEAVSPLATSGRTVGDVLARIKERELPLLQFLCASGLLALSSEPAKPERIGEAAPEVDDKGKAFTRQEQSAREMLFADLDRLREATHYQVLGLAQAATLEEVKAAYIAAAKRYHCDAFSGMELGSARRVAEQLFARVNEANAVLSDKNRRADYDIYLDRKSKGLPTDVGAILRAEGLFQKGEAFFKAGRWDDAEAQFREAIALNHAEAEFHAYLGMSIFRKTGQPDGAVEHLRKSLQVDPRLRSGALFLAQVLEAQGEVEQARALLRKAIDRDPEFSQAKQELQRLRSQPAEQTKGGLLSRLLKK